MRLSVIIVLFAMVFSSQAQEPATPVDDTAMVYTSLESALQNPDRVYKLNLSKKKLTVFPEQIFQFKNLVELDLSKNKIKELPARIGELTHLEKFLIASNYIVDVPDEIGNLTSLHMLGLNRNLIEQLPKTIGSLTQLEVLELWDNELEGIPDEIAKLTNLRILELRGILFSDEEQKRVRAMLPNTEVYFSPACNCKN